MRLVAHEDHAAGGARDAPVPAALAPAHPPEAAARPAPARPAGDALAGTLARAVATRGAAAKRLLLQREVTIRKRTYRDEFRDFTFTLQQTLKRRGYTFPNRLNLIIALALQPDRDLRVTTEQRAAAANIEGKTFASWDHFVDFLAENDYIAARLPVGKPSRLRARTLGMRPAWIAPLTALRVDHRGQAARHVIPSHFLGWVAEHWTPSDEQYQQWLQEARGLAPYIGDVRRTAHTSLTARRRYVWEILHNHPGNLWWGPSADNTVIGFLAPYLERLLHTLDTLGDAGGLTLDALRVHVESGLPPLGSNAGEIGERWREVAETLQFLDHESAGVTAGDVRNAVEDAFLQTELDPREIGQWGEAVALYDAMKGIAGDPAGAVLLRFLRTRFTGTIGEYAGSDADDVTMQTDDTDPRGTKRGRDGQETPAPKKRKTELVS